MEVSQNFQNVSLMFYGFLDICLLSFDVNFVYLYLSLGYVYGLYLINVCVLSLNDVFLTFFECKATIVLVAYIHYLLWDAFVTMFDDFRCAFRCYMFLVCRCYSVVSFVFVIWCLWSLFNPPMHIYYLDINVILNFKHILEVSHRLRLVLFPMLMFLN